MFYDLLKGLHNLLRWVIVLGGLYALVVTVRGLLTGASWGPAERRAGLIFTISLHTQLLVGLVLYGVSPLIRGAFANMSAAMGNDELRFFTVEHFAVMILAVVAAQLGFSLARRAENDRAKFARAAVGYVAAAVLILYGIPWGRSLVPWL